MIPGYTHYLNKLSQPPPYPIEVIARVIIENKSDYLITTNNQTLTAILPRTHRQDKNMPLPKVGDFVVYKKEEDKYLITQILSRYSTLSRTKNKTDQIISVNIDQVLIVACFDKHFNLRRVLSLILAAKSSKIKTNVIITKIDILPSSEEAIKIINEVSNQEALLVSVKTEKNTSKLKDLFTKDSTTLLLGESGVGKSTLTNYLTNENSQKIATVETGQGKHVTTKRSLITLPNQAFIIDIPGIRSFYKDIVKEDMFEMFPELQKLTTTCKYTNCDHIKSADCGLKKALSEGSLSQIKYDLLIQ